MAKKKNTPVSVEIPDEYILIAADLSLKRPGFCVLHIDRSNVINVKTFSVDNKTKTKQRGVILAEIAEAFNMILNLSDLPIFLVREQSINNCGGKMARSSTAARTGVSAVVGVMDLIAWQHGKLTWEEFYPTSIKKLLTGRGNADKTDVANALPAYLGQIEYKNDDESDAAAVAVAWMIHHGQITQINQEDISSE